MLAEFACYDGAQTTKSARYPKLVSHESRLLQQGAADAPQTYDE